MGYRPGAVNVTDGEFRLNYFTAGGSAHWDVSVDGGDFYVDANADMDSSGFDLTLESGSVTVGSALKLRDQVMTGGTVNVNANLVADTLNWSSGGTFVVAASTTAIFGQ